MPSKRVLTRPPLEEKEVKIQQDKTARFVASVAFLFVFVCVGFPVWWKTTQVYRAAIPVGKIENLLSDEHPLRLPCPLRLFAHLEGGKETRVVAKFTQTVADLLWTELQDFSQEGNFRVDFTVDPESLSEQQTAFFSKQFTLDQLDYYPAGEASELHSLDVLVSPFGSFEGDMPPVHFGGGRTVFLKIKGDEDPQDVAQLIFETLKGFLSLDELKMTARRATNQRVAEAKKTMGKIGGKNGFCDFLQVEDHSSILASVQSPVFDLCTFIVRQFSTESSSRDLRHDDKTEPEPKTVLAPQNVGDQQFFGVVTPPRLALDIYLVNPRPDQRSDTELDLKIELEDDLGPFFDALKSIFELSLTSERLYYVDFDIEPTEKSRNDGEKSYYYDSAALTTLTAPIEKYMTSLTEFEALFRLLIYVTPPSFTPLHFEVAPNRLSDAFSLASWGAVLVHNSEINETAATTPFNLALKQTLVAQLRLLLGVNSGKFSRHPFSKSSHPLAEWERIRLAYKALIDFTFTAATTLRSLLALLDRIGNIVIEDRVARQVEKSVAHIAEAYRLAGKEQELFKAVEQARLAVLSADSAFFDPSLLELLYFPDDQKYAIYIPLFLPVGLPLALVIFSALKAYLAKVRGKTDDKEKED